MSIWNKIKTKFKEINDKQKAKSEILQFLLDAVDDGVLTDEELLEIKERSEELGLSEKDLKPFLVKAYKQAFEISKADGIVTAEEEKELEKIQFAFGIEDALILKSKSELAELRLISEIMLGNLPNISGPPGFIAQENEIVHWVESGQLYEEKTVTVGYVGSSAGVSIRIAKGIRYRVGTSRKRAIKETLNVPISKGFLIVTNKRLVFKGDDKSIALKLNKLISVDPYIDGITIHPDTGKPKMISYQKNNGEIIGAIISQAINDY